MGLSAPSISPYTDNRLPRMPTKANGNVVVMQSSNLVKYRNLAPKQLNRKLNRMLHGNRFTWNIRTNLVLVAITSTVSSNTGIAEFVFRYRNSLFRCATQITSSAFWTRRLQFGERIDISPMKRTSLGQEKRLGQSTSEATARHPPDSLTDRYRKHQHYFEEYGCH